MAEDINYQIVPEEKFEIILMVQSVRILPNSM